MFRNSSLVLSALTLTGLVACASPNDSTTATSEDAIVTSGAAEATSIVRATLSREGDTNLSLGFSDSSFDYETTEEAQGRTAFCFLGAAEGVCDAIGATIDAKNEEMLDGAHDFIEEFSCALGEYGVVEARYRLLDDYGYSFRVKRELHSCDAAAATTTTIVQAHADASGVFLTELADSSFFYESQLEADKAAFCFVGPAAGACDTFEAYVAAKTTEYKSGAHDVIEELACSVDDSVVTASYRLVDDYGGDLRVTRRISPCAEH